MENNMNKKDSLSSSHKGLHERKFKLLTGADDMRFDGVREALEVKKALLKEKMKKNATLEAEALAAGLDYDPMAYADEPSFLRQA